METFEAFKKCVGHNYAEFGKRLGLSKSTIYKYSEPSDDYTDSGTRNPLDVINICIDGALADGVCEENALAPLYCLAQRYGRIVLMLPKEPVCEPALTQQLLKTIEEFSQLTREVSADLKHGCTHPHAARRIHKEGWEAIAAITNLIQLCEQAVKK